WRGRPALDAWLAQQVEGAIDDVLAEGLQPDGPLGARPSDGGARSAAGGDAACDDARLDFARRLGWSPDAARRAFAAFPGAAASDREAFWLLAIEDLEFDAAAAALGASASEVGRRARRVLEAALAAAEGAPRPARAPAELRLTVRARPTASEPR